MATTTTNDMMYSDDEYAQLLAARARRAELKPTPLAPQPVQSTTAEQEKRRNASLNTNRGFSLLK